MNASLAISMNDPIDTSATFEIHELSADDLDLIGGGDVVGNYDGQPKP